MATFSGAAKGRCTLLPIELCISDFLLNAQRAQEIFIESFINLISLSTSRFSFTDQFGAWLLPVLCLLSLFSAILSSRGLTTLFFPSALLSSAW